MTRWRLFKKHPDTRAASDHREIILSKLPQPQSSSRRHRAASIHSRHSSRSSRSSRSSTSRSQCPPGGVQQRTSRSSHRSSHHRTFTEPRRCFACARMFSGSNCATCETSYDNFTLKTDSGAIGDPAPLDFGLAFDLAAVDDYLLLEQLVSSMFASIETTVPCFIDSGRLSTEKIDLLYEILATPTSTSPMRAVLQGAQQALLNRKYQRLSYTELQYLLIVLRSPVFVQCSMFTKITGPLQKLGRYSSFRSRARIILDTSMGLLSNMPQSLRTYTLEYMQEMATPEFQSGVDLLNSYIGHRLMFHFSLKAPNRQQVRGRDEIKCHWYSDDWRIAAAAKMLSLFFAASQAKTKLPLSSFYNMISDHIDLGSDYDSWQALVKRRGTLSTTELWDLDPSLTNKFCFCEYAFILTITSKSAVFRHSLSRKVRELQLQTENRPQSQHLNRNPSSSASSVYSNQYARATNAANSALHAAWAYTHQPKENTNLQMLIRRDHLLTDSVALLVAKTENELKKPLRIEFHGEPGIDAGGLCKEWVHLLFNQLTDPAKGLFVQDEGSAFSWFGNSNDLDHYMAMGVALGLSLNNGMMIDSYMPPLAYKLLLDKEYGMDDVAQVWPAVTQSLNAILEYQDPDFEGVFGLCFTAPDGTNLCPDGDNVAVTSENRHQYVEALVKHMDRPTEQFSTFKAGFMRACDTAALRLFTAVEMESLIRGERKPVDLDTLRNNTRYLHWGSKKDIAKEPVIIWFWDFFKSLNPEQQALLLVFITATPRVPATGISSMQFRISCLGSDSDRLPTAHTCFNQLGLYRYRSRKKLYEKLTLAMTECQSFGIK